MLNDHMCSPHTGAPLALSEPPRPRAPTYGRAPYVQGVAVPNGALWAGAPKHSF